MLKKMMNGMYRVLMVGACIAMVVAFLSIALGIVAREAAWNIQGLDAYAGYAIAAALFLALPETLKQGDHIRVSLLADRLSSGPRHVLEHVCAFIGVGLSGYLAFFSGRLVWISWTTHDVSQAVDATPLWIPQIAMATGAIGLFLAFLDAWFHLIRRETFFATRNEAARVE